MSDGMYSFNEIRGQDIFSGIIQVSQGKFRGENDIYQYHGVFSIKDHVLQGSVIVKNKKTETLDHIPLSTSLDSEEEFKIVIDINGQRINLLCQKEQARPLMR